MSKHNKVNPGQYHQAGRMTPDEAARERLRIQQVSPRDDEAGAPKSDETAASPHIPGAQDPGERGGPITRTARRKAAARR